MAADSINGVSGNSDSAYAASLRRSTDNSFSSVNFEDYITLMVAQLKNQDMYNTADTTEMTSQLAQYSLVSAAESIISAQNTNYAATLVGKQVTASYEDSTGQLVTNTGTVTGITLYEGEPLVYVNGVPYNLGEVMIVGTTETETAETETADSTAETDSESNVTDAASEQTDTVDTVDTIDTADATKIVVPTEETDASDTEDTSETAAEEESSGETVI